MKREKMVQKERRSGLLSMVARLLPPGHAENAMAQACISVHIFAVMHGHAHSCTVMHSHAHLCTVLGSYTDTFFFLKLERVTG